MELKTVDSESNPGLSKLPTEVRNKMGYMKSGGGVKMKSGGTASSRADGCCTKGKTKGTMVKMKSGGMC